MSQVRLYLDEDAMRPCQYYIIVAPHYSVGEELRRIMRLISRRVAEEMRSRLEFISAWA
jgi:hypothetical protein